MTDSKPAPLSPIKALVVGGDNGFANRTLPNVLSKFRKDGRPVLVQWHWSHKPPATGGIPAGCELVFLMISQSSHSLSQQGAAMAKAAGVPTVTGSFKATECIESFRRAGFTYSSNPVPVPVAPAVEPAPATLTADEKAAVARWKNARLRDLACRQPSDTFENYRKVIRAEVAATFPREVEDTPTLLNVPDEQLHRALLDVGAHPFDWPIYRNACRDRNIPPALSPPPPNTEITMPPATPSNVRTFLLHNPSAPFHVLHEKFGLSAERSRAARRELGIDTVLGNSQSGGIYLQPAFYAACDEAKLPHPDTGLPGFFVDQGPVDLATLPPSSLFQKALKFLADDPTVDVTEECGILVFGSSKQDPTVVYPARLEAVREMFKERAAPVAPAPAARIAATPRAAAPDPIAGSKSHEEVALGFLKDYPHLPKQKLKNHLARVGMPWTSLTTAEFRRLHALAQPVKAPAPAPPLAPVPAQTTPDKTVAADDIRAALHLLVDALAAAGYDLSTVQIDVGGRKLTGKKPVVITVMQDVEIV
jgi:hypothetical protein